MTKKLKFEHMNKVTHSVRVSQAVLQYGVGAMIDFPDQTLMTAAPKYWEKQVRKVHDERLEKILNVDYFGVPLGQNDDNDNVNNNDNDNQCGISYVRFPEWYFCPICRRFKPIKEWINYYKHYPSTRGKAQDDPEMVRHMRCPKCRESLVVTRIVAVCECGHIDDFPWVEWVHSRSTGGPREICKQPELEFKTGASSNESLSGQIITCKCGARATLTGAFEKDTFKKLGFRCTGRHPWKGQDEIERCTEYPRGVQRGSSSVYFPVTASSLVIPPYSSRITKEVEDSGEFGKLTNVIDDYKDENPGISMNELSEYIKGRISRYSGKIAEEITEPQEEVMAVLERRLLPEEGQGECVTTDVRYRFEEYRALNGEVYAGNRNGDFLREETNIGKYGIPYVKNITLINKIREVQALIGFSRLNPAKYVHANDEDAGRIVSIKEPWAKWYPACEVYGEGIFMEFDEKEIAAWQAKNNDEIQKRVDAINENYAKSSMGKSRPRKITAKFLLLHTISHQLIKQLSFNCGYSIASLKERLYCSEPENGREMTGILIYTASGDSEGTLGGLVRQGRSDVFPALFRRAVESTRFCSNDPVCSLSRGQGRDSLNLAACYSCTLIPETSCEEFNIFLDRGMIAGTYENRGMGLYSPQLYDSAPWKSTVHHIPKFIVLDKEIDHSESSYRVIWNSLRTWASETGEKTLLSELVNMEAEFSRKEKPYAQCEFKITGDTGEYTCDLYWEKSKVAFFTAYNEKSYLAAKDSDVKCFLGTDAATTPDIMLDAIKDV